MSFDVGKTSKTNIPDCQNCYYRVYFEKIINMNNPYLIWSPRNISALYDQRRLVIKCAEWTENQWGGKVKALLTYFPNLHNGIESDRFLIICISGKIRFFLKFNLLLHSLCSGVFLL